jgi:hypothetical protein
MDGSEIHSPLNWVWLSLLDSQYQQRKRPPNAEGRRAVFLISADGSSALTDDEMLCSQLFCREQSFTDSPNEVSTIGWCFQDSQQE